MAAGRKELCGNYEGERRLLSELPALYQLNSEAAFGAAFFISYANCFLKFWGHEGALSQILCIERPSTDRLTKGSNRYTRTGLKGFPCRRSNSISTQKGRPPSRNFYRTSSTVVSLTPLAIHYRLEFLLGA